MLIIHIYVLYVYKRICATLYVLRKRKACCKKGMGHNEGFSNLTVVANVLNNYLDNFI